LRELGVRVKGRPATGYFLETVPDILLPDLLRKRLKGSLFGKRFHHFFKTDSTNRIAMELGYAEEPEGTVVLAEEQTGGRGRAGRSWYSERGTGIYVTLLLRPRLGPVQAPLLTMLAGLSARAAIQAQTGLTVDLKWPNDLMLNGQKIGGILTEMHAEPSLVRFVALGIGLNVNQEKFPAELLSVATSLRRASGRFHSRLEILVRLLSQLENDYNRFLREGPPYVVERFQLESEFAHGKRVRVDTGMDSYQGVSTGLSPEGLLIVKKDDGRVMTVIAGDVTEVQ
jgi:BirA family biotin operon repressor/biotin-[acetyl-CoA-carboxylase] ligase